MTQENSNTLLDISIYDSEKLRNFPGIFFSVTNLTEAVSREVFNEKRCS